MQKHALYIAATAFATGLILNPVAKSFAGDEAAPGIVRISDMSSPTIQQVSHLRLLDRGLFHRRPLLGRRTFVPYGTNSCGCSQCSGHSYHGQFGHYLYADRGPLRNMLSLDNSCTYSPGHGWARPTPHPIQENPVEYRRYWPAKWYGQPGGGVSANAPRYPSIYMPTDTTQLGYYYQRVPQWRPNPGMIPPPPWPPYWHARDCSVNGCQQVTIGKIGDRWHYGPHPQQPVPQPQGKAQDNKAVPPAPPAGDDKSASNVQLIPIPNF